MAVIRAEHFAAGSETLLMFMARLGAVVSACAIETNGVPSGYRVECRVMCPAYDIECAFCGMLHFDIFDRATHRGGVVIPNSSQENRNAAQNLIGTCAVEHFSFRRWESRSVLGHLKKCQRKISPAEYESLQLSCTYLRIPIFSDNQQAAGFKFLCLKCLDPVAHLCSSISWLWKDGSAWFRPVPSISQRLELWVAVLDRHDPVCSHELKPATLHGETGPSQNVQTTGPYQDSEYGFDGPEDTYCPSQSMHGHETLPDEEEDLGEISHHRRVQASDRCATRFHKIALPRPGTPLFDSIMQDPFEWNMSRGVSAFNGHLARVVLMDDEGREELIPYCCPLADGGSCCVGLKGFSQPILLLGAGRRAMISFRRYKCLDHGNRSWTLLADEEHYEYSAPYRAQMENVTMSHNVFRSPTRAYDAPLLDFVLTTMLNSKPFSYKSTIAAVHSMMKSTYYSFLATPAGRRANSEDLQKLRQNLFEMQQHFSRESLYGLLPKLVRILEEYLGHRIDQNIETTTSLAFDTTFYLGANIGAMVGKRWKKRKMLTTLALNQEGLLCGFQRHVTESHADLRALLVRIETHPKFKIHQLLSVSTDNVRKDTKLIKSVFGDHIKVVQDIWHVFVQRIIPSIPRLHPDSRALKRDLFDLFATLRSSDQVWKDESDFRSAIERIVLKYARIATEIDLHLLCASDAANVPVLPTEDTDEEPTENSPMCDEDSTSEIADDSLSDEADDDWDLNSPNLRDMEGFPPIFSSSTGAVIAPGDRPELPLTSPSSSDSAEPVAVVGFPNSSADVVTTEAHQNSNCTPEVESGSKSDHVQEILNRNRSVLDVNRLTDADHAPVPLMFIPDLRAKFNSMLDPINLVGLFFYHQLAPSVEAGHIFLGTNLNENSHRWANAFRSMSKASVATGLLVLYLALASKEISFCLRGRLASERKKQKTVSAALGLEERWSFSAGRNWSACDRTFVCRPHREEDTIADEEPLRLSTSEIDNQIVEMLKTMDDRGTLNSKTLDMVADELSRLLEKESGHGHRAPSYYRYRLYRILTKRSMI